MKTIPAWHGLVIVGLLAALYGIGLSNAVRHTRRKTSTEGDVPMRVLGFALIRADRLNDEYWRGFRLGHRTARHTTVAMLRRPVETSDVETATYILDDLTRHDPTALDTDAVR